MNINNNFILNRVFSNSTFDGLLADRIDSTYCAVVNNYIQNPCSKNNQELISEIYKYMGRFYRNEYFYKNTILNKLLLGRHSLRTTTALSEVPIGKSKADFILINGKAVVYEIKTDLDSFDRLQSQLSDYYKAFNSVCVVTCESNSHILEKKLKNTSVGICTLTDKNTLRTVKEPTVDVSKLDLSIMFKVLRKSEYESIIDTVYGGLPQVSQFKYYSECKKQFCALTIDVAYQLFLRELKKRQSPADGYSDVPYELKSLMYFGHYGESDYVKLRSFLNSRYGG